MGKNTGQKVERPLDFSGCEAFSNLPHQQQVFVLEYLKDFNASRAGRAAKYSPKTITASTSRVLASVNVRAALKEVSDIVFNRPGVIADAQEIAAFLTRTMRGNIQDVCRWNEDGLTFTESSEEMSREKAGIIKKVKVTEKSSAAGDWTECKTEVELHDPIRAAELLGRYLGIWKDKIEVEGLKDLSERLARAISRAKNGDSEED